MTRTMDVTRELVEEINDIFDDSWQVTVLDDDVTTFDIVITALTKIFGHSRDAAEALAWRVHREGKAIVAVLPEREAKDSVKKLHGYKIQAACARA